MIITVKKVTDNGVSHINYRNKVLPWTKELYKNHMEELKKFLGK